MYGFKADKSYDANRAEYRKVQKANDAAKLRWTSPALRRRVWSKRLHLKAAKVHYSAPKSRLIFQILSTCLDVKGE